MASEDVFREGRSYLAELFIKATAENMATAAAPSQDSDQPSSVNLTNTEKTSGQLRIEAHDKLAPWENKFIESVVNRSNKLHSVASGDTSASMSLSRRVDKIVKEVIQYALAKREETLNLEAQIETYKTEVDLLRQENYDLTQQEQGNGGVDGSQGI